MKEKFWIVVSYILLSKNLKSIINTPKFFFQIHAFRNFICVISGLSNSKGWKLSLSFPPWLCFSPKFPNYEDLINPYSRFLFWAPQYFHWSFFYFLGHKQMPTSIVLLFLVLTITSYEHDEAAEHPLVSSLLSYTSNSSGRCLMRPLLYDFKT